MAAVLCAELRLRDGQKRTVQVETVQTSGTTGGIASLISAVRELSTSVTCLLTELVQQEQGRGACAAESDGEDEDEDEDKEDDDDDEDEEKHLRDSGPDPKRTKV